ncbi:Diaminopimelate epimerase [Neolewinella maritima]|uniref:Diaminopimelate epimerase n=1 Tax=Neolewinella maritima TaxID=1383882 RepID=A0ABM9AZ89_9BACT|nr:diaminopimelate epimerase [Neolewinella maritima]CAH1000172.1 Diaminopimelate epimerase [Neolewinella maritima]
MILDFHKYHGAGNDFILLDDRQSDLVTTLTQPQIAHLCHRHFGIGADGLMLLRHAPSPYDFEMVYYNSDGRPSSMCGNGGRCIVRFAADLGIARSRYHFLAVDGAHDAYLTPEGNVSLGMNKVDEVRRIGEDWVLDTGSPHYLQFVESVDAVDTVEQGRKIRYSPTFAEAGINVNFVQQTADGLRILTYERGVENETLACGTGVTAAAIGSILRQPNTQDGPFRIPVEARGGQLYVNGKRQGDTFSHLQLIGPAVAVYTGTIRL